MYIPKVMGGWNGFVRGVFAIVVALTLSACVSSPRVEGERVGFGAGDALNFFDTIREATAEDAAVARALAERAGNETWARCWATVERVKREQLSTDRGPEVDPVGPLSALQAASNVYRDARGALEDVLDERVRGDCSVVAADIIRFARRGALRLLPFVN